jgi:predicted alpha/beta-hydrolase family hydrolase
MVFRRALTPLAASLDRAVARRLFGRTSARVRALGHDERLEALGAIAAAYEPAFVTDFFGDAPAALALSPLGRRDGIAIADARWPSRVTTFHPDAELARRFAAVTENHRAAARLFLQPDPRRPAAILVHGYRAGSPAIEERIWPVRWLLARGMSVALFVLPFHAVRRDPRGPLRFPSSDPRFTNEGFRQAIGDLRGLVRWLRERGANAVGAMGMSLGGYTTSLLATVEELDFLVPVIPLACFADAARHSGRLVGSPDEQAIQHQWIERAHRVVSPFARPSRVEAEAVVVLGGEGDRITPIAHAERLARHFGGDLIRFPGGHLLQLGRAQGFRAVGRMLRRRGLSRRATRDEP